MFFPPTQTFTTLKAVHYSPVEFIDVINYWLLMVLEYTSSKIREKIENNMTSLQNSLKMIFSTKINNEFLNWDFYFYIFSLSLIFFSKFLWNEKISFEILHHFLAAPTIFVLWLKGQHSCFRSKSNCLFFFQFPDVKNKWVWNYSWDYQFSRIIRAERNKFSLFSTWKKRLKRKLNFLGIFHLYFSVFVFNISFIWWLFHHTLLVFLQLQ